VQAMGHLGRGGARRDDVAEGRGCSLEECALLWREVLARRADHEEHAPRTGRAGNHHRGLASAAGCDAWLRTRIVVDGVRCCGKRRPEDAVSERQLDRLALGQADGPDRRQVVAPDVPDRDGAVRAGDGDRIDRGTERVAPVLATAQRGRGDVGERGGEADGRFDLGRALRGLARSRSLRGPLGARAPRPALRARRGRVACPSVARRATFRSTRAAAGGTLAGERRAQEALEVAKPVAPITAWVDPVEAEPSGVAPGSDGVRANAKDLGGPADRQRGVERPRPIRVRGGQRRVPLEEM